MQRYCAACDVARSVVCVIYACVCVCFCVDHTDMPCLNHRNAVWGLTQVGPRNHVLDGGGDSPREGAILGSCRAQQKALGVSAAIFSAKRSQSKFSITASITAWQRTAVLPTDRCHITLSAVKNSPTPAMRPFVEIFLTLVCVCLCVTLVLYA